MSEPGDRSFMSRVRSLFASWWNAFLWWMLPLVFFLLVGWLLALAIQGPRTMGPSFYPIF